MRTWKTKQLDRGTGCTCPRADCKAKVIVNLDAVVERRKKDAAERTLHPRPVKTMCCPVCYRASKLPKHCLEELGYDDS